MISLHPSQTLVIIPVCREGGSQLYYGVVKMLVVVLTDHYRWSGQQILPHSSRIAGIPQVNKLCPDCIGTATRFIYICIKLVI